MNEINLTGKELGDFEDTAEGKKALRAAAKSEFEKLLGEWVSCPALGADVELRKIGLKKVISQSADIRKLKIIPKLKELISASKKIGEKPNYDKANSPNIIAYHTLRAVLKLAENEIAVRFVISQDDKGAYHYDHTIVSTEAVFDSALANENGLTQVSPFGLMGGNQGFTHNRSAIPEPTCLLPVEPSTGHQLDSSVVDNNENINDDFALDAVSTGGMVFNLFIEGEEPESVEPQPTENTITPEIEPATEISLTGKELGDFEDTEEGKKALRKAAKEFLQTIRGEWVDCPILGGKVEIRQRGIKEIIAFSADPRKLKLMPALKQLIKSASSSDKQQNKKLDKKPEVMAYYHLHSSIILEETKIFVQVIIEEDRDGLLHYDMIIDDDAVALPLDNNSRNTTALDSTVIEDDENINDDFALDAVSTGGMIFNLFIEDEEPELVEPQPTENTIAPEMPDYKVPELPQGGLEPNESDLDEQAGIVN